MTLFDRIWQLKVAFNNKPPKIYQKLSQEDIGLHITFKTEMAIAGTSPSGDITITGLPLADLEFLATNYKPESGQLQDSQVELQAGYDKILSIILFGNVYQTTPNFTSPDYSINLKVMNGLLENQMNAFATVSMKGRVTLRDILANVAKQLSKSLEIDASISNRAFSDFAFQGSPMELIDNLKSYYPDIQITPDNKALKVTSTKSPKKPKYKITPSSGLIGTPIPTPQGCEIKTLLLCNLAIGDFIELESHKLHRLDGVYQIIKLSHQGSSRDSSYYSNLTLLNKSFMA